MVSRQSHSAQVEYFINVYWDKHCNANKDEIFGIFGEFHRRDEFRSEMDTHEV